MQCVGGVIVPPSVHCVPIALVTQDNIQWWYHLHKDIKGKEIVCKTVQNQALFFSPSTSAPFISIIIIIAVIIANIIFENTTHRRLPAREKILKDTAAFSSAIGY